ncbi:hypothetical protein RUM44_004480 [Polyplax serrata]|uniref:Uncharacterized protein n=1 Tax=Polyplax serrata TaxID=468196 RepID=A0ABR1B4P2_POLSC
MKAGSNESSRQWLEPKSLSDLSDNSKGTEAEDSETHLLKTENPGPGNLKVDIKRKMPGLEKIRQIARKNMTAPEKLTKGEFQSE